MRLWVGLGNPGPKYAGNRHNIGWMALDAIAAQYGFGPWRAKFQGELAEGWIADVRVGLLKPLTFMNLSGQSVQAAMSYLKLTPHMVTVWHDEIDLAPGKVRLKQGGGHAGHNGLRSIAQHVGPDTQRVRLGVGHPGDKDRVADYVLSDFDKAESAWLEPLLPALAAAAPALIGGDGPGFLNRLGLSGATPDATARSRAGGDA